MLHYTQREPHPPFAFILLSKCGNRVNLLIMRAHVGAQMGGCGCLRITVQYLVSREKGNSHVKVNLGLQSRSRETTGYVLLSELPGGQGQIRLSLNIFSVFN
jgi:hypothetical protein